MAEHEVLSLGAAGRVDLDLRGVWYPDVLVVEDNERMLDGLMRALRRQVMLGSVRGASDGVDGLRITLSQRPGVLLIDHRLPSLSGLEVARALNRAPSGGTTAVVMMSASPDDELRAAASHLGVFAVVDKALDRRLICETVVRASQALRR